VSFFDYSYRFSINFELFCSELSVFDIPEFTGRYPFPTFSFTDSDLTKNYTGENCEGFFRPFSPYMAHVSHYHACGGGDWRWAGRIVRAWNGQLLRRFTRSRSPPFRSVTLGAGHGTGPHDESPPSRLSVSQQ
jgi:hypothetical protein